MDLYCAQNMSVYSMYLNWIVVHKNPPLKQKYTNRADVFHFKQFDRL